MEQLGLLQLGRIPDPPMRARQARCAGGAEQEDAELRTRIDLARPEVLEQQDPTDAQIRDPCRRSHGPTQALVPGLTDADGRVGEVPSSIGGVQQQDAEFRVADDRHLGDLVQGVVPVAWHQGSLSQRGRLGPSSIVHLPPASTGLTSTLAVPSKASSSSAPMSCPADVGIFR